MIDDESALLAGAPCDSATFVTANCLLFVPGSRDSKDPDPDQQANRPREVTCPYCLGLGEKLGANASKPAVTCSCCGGRGFLKSVPKPDKL